jgi:hypothetical protein
LLESRGNSPRVNQNSLVFLAPDMDGLESLIKAGAELLGWEDVLTKKDELDLSPSTVKQAEARHKTAKSTFELRLPEAFMWLIYPTQSSATTPVQWIDERLTGQDSLAVRASKKLISSEQLLISFGPNSLRKELDNVPLWKSEYVRIKDLIGYFAQYLYLPRLKSSDVLLEAIEQGLSRVNWSTDTFAYADEFDSSSGQYKGLDSGKLIRPVLNETSVLVKCDVASALLIKQRESSKGPISTPAEFGGVPTTATFTPMGTPAPANVQPKVFYASVPVKDPSRFLKEAGTLNTEVISQLTAIYGAEAEITIEVRINVHDGIPDNVRKAVTENCKTLKYQNFNFEE